MKKIILSATVIFYLLLFSNNSFAQNIFPANGRAGIYTTSPAASLQVKGGARIGTLTNYVNIDSATGSLSFIGTAIYQVANNQYAFQNSANPGVGLYFNSTNARYEFRNTAASPTFYVGANTGNGVFIGSLKVGAYTLPATDGANGQVLKSNGAGVLTWSADNNSVYSPGTGINIASNIITNTAPDETVVLNNGAGITVTGTYPSFTIASTITQGSNTALSNLVATSINQSLVPSANNSLSLGNGSKAWRNIYIDSAIYLNNQKFLFSGSVAANTFGGVNSGNSNTTGASNTAFGNSALSANNTGSYNTATGTDALLSNTSGISNTANGSYSLVSNSTGISNVAIGSDALHNNNGNNNTAAGASALYSNTTGIGNVATGTNALTSNVTGNYNTASGTYALQLNTGSENTANGASSLHDNTTGQDNTASGFAALNKNNAGVNNSANGAYALYLNTTGQQNTATGYASLYSNVNGNYNAAHGAGALNSNIDGLWNTGNGAYAMYLNTHGGYNTATGGYALYSNTTGGGNTANGYSALYGNTTGIYNTAIGSYALDFNTTGNYNIANGYQSLYKNTDGSWNVAEGYETLWANTTGTYNTANGYLALYNNTTGNNNCAFGEEALDSNTTGELNVALGVAALNTNKTGSYNIGIGYAATTNDPNYHDAVAIGTLATTTSSEQVRIGDSHVLSIGGYANWTQISDGRVKKNIKANVPGLDFIKKLKPVTYNLDLDAADKIIQRPQIKDMDGKIIEIKEDVTSRKAKEQIVYTGFIAQDVEKAAKSLNYDFSGVDAAKNDKDLYGLRYADFVVPLVKAVQELSKENDSLKNQNNTQQTQIDNLQNQINELKSMIISNKSTAINQQSTILSIANLQQNIPNPFNHTTTIGYTLPQKFTTAQIIITDNTGKTLKAVNISGSGKGALNVDAATLASGAYNYSLIVDGKLIGSKQMELAK